MSHPTKCSQCDSLYAVSGDVHCKNVSCDWVVCRRCGNTVSKSSDSFFRTATTK